MPHTSQPAERSQVLRRLRDRAVEARNAPGVYRFIGVRGEVLYVGKSVAVRRRLLSYFRARGRSKEHELIRVTGEIEWEYLPNEFEALLREYRLIRAFRPRFNRHHRRMRRYAWIRMTSGSVPRLRAARTPTPDGSRYFGPFPAPACLPDLLRELEHTAGLGSDVPDLSHPNLDQLDLLEEGVEKATSPSRRVHAGVSGVVRFLEGADDDLLADLGNRRAIAVEDQRYELAARMRDREARLRTLRNEVVAFREVLRKLSCVYRPLPGDDAGTDPPQAYLLSFGRMLFRFPWPPGGRLDVDVADRIRALASEPAPPPDALREEEREEAFVVARWFRANPAEWERTWSVAQVLPA